MERINRENYLSILKNFKDQQIIKVITGIRRCGKSTLLEIFGDYLKENGQLWLVINKDQGAKSLFKDLAEVFDTEIIKKNKGFFIIKAKKR